RRSSIPILALHPLLELDRARSRLLSDRGRHGQITPRGSMRETDHRQSARLREPVLYGFARSTSFRGPAIGRPAYYHGADARPGQAGRSRAPSVAEAREPGPEHQERDRERADRADQHGAGGDVLGALHERMDLRRCDVAERLEGGVERLGRPDGDDRQYHREPFAPADAEGEAQADGGRAADCVDPGFVLGREHDPDPTQCISDARDARSGGEVLPPPRPQPRAPGRLALKTSWRPL